MNFIDNILEKLNKMSADDFIQSMTRIYSEPIDRAKVKKYPQFVQDVIFIIDYDTELQMEGLSGFLNNSTKNYIDETIVALKNCGAIKDSEILKKCKDIVRDDDDIIDKLAQKIYLYNNFDELWFLLDRYVEREKYLNSTPKA